jgi:hypothetical protein
MALLSKATLNMLEHLWGADIMTARYSDVQRASGVTHKGFTLVLNRATDNNYVVRTSVEYYTLALTFGGMMALRSHYTKLYNDRPCEAYRLQMEKYSRVPDRKVVAA